MSSLRVVRLVHLLFLSSYLKARDRELVSFVGVPEFSEGGYVRGGVLDV